MRNKVQGVIKLTGMQVNNKLVCCTGSQLVIILDVIEEKLGKCNWYVADISATHLLSYDMPGQSKWPSLVGNTEDLKIISAQVIQFFSGIFLAMPINSNMPRWSDYLDTEDIPTNDLGDAVLEIRAFDTSYFEIYSSHSEVLDLLRYVFLRTEN